MTIYIHRTSQPNSPSIDIEQIDSPDLVWLDLFRATKGEEDAVEQWLEMEVITEPDDTGPEESSLLYIENDIAFMRINVPAREGAEPYQKPIEPSVYYRANLRFVLSKKILISVRNAALRALEVGQSRASARMEGVLTSGQAFLVLLESLVERQADLLARTAIDLDAVSLPILAQKQLIKTESRIKILGQLGAQLSLSRDCLFDLGRMIHFLGPIASRYALDKKRLMALLVDIKDLQRLCEAQFNDLSFLLDASLGLVGARQSKALNFMAVVTLLFAPPTLISSIFGMNFEFMTLFKDPIGPIFAMGLMVVSSLTVLVVAKLTRLI